MRERRDRQRQTTDRRSNWVGRLIVAVHTRYYQPALVPWLWIALLIAWVAQIVIAQGHR